MYLQDPHPSAQVRQRHHHLPVETPGAEQSGIQHIRTVGGRDENHAFIGFKTIHFHQQLVQGLLPFVMPPAQACAALPPHGINLINENQARRIFFALGEQITHPGRADAHEHFHKVRTGNGKKRHPGLSSDGSGQKRLPRARGAHQQHALGDASPQTGKPFRLPQEFHHFHKFLLGLVHSGHILEGHLGGFFAEHLGFGTPKRHDPPSAGLHLTHEVYPHADQKQHGKPGHQYREIPGRLLLRLSHDPHVIGQKCLHQFGVVGIVGHEVPFIKQNALNPLPLDPHFDDFAVADLGQEFAIAQLLFRSRGLAEKIEQDHHHHGNRDPKQ